MYYNAKRINEGYTSRINTLTAEVASLRKKIADDESEHSHQEKLARAKNNLELDELITRLRALEAERNKAISERDQALRSEASALGAAEQAKAEADRRTRENKEKEESPEGLFQHGVFEYMSQNYSEALKLFTKSAEKGNAEAENMIGVMHGTGRGVSTDKAKAKEWYRKAAIHGCIWGQRNYGYLLEEERKYTEAKLFYEMAAEQNNTSAMVELGRMYYNGNGVSKSAYTAFTWYKKAADLRDYEAMNLLGVLYHRGEGVSQSYSSAFTWLKKSAEGGDAWGQLNLAYAYENGYGTAKDLAKAREWYEKAAAQGNEDAKKWLDQHQLNGTISRSRFETLCASSASYMKSELERLRVSPNFKFPDGDKPTLLMLAAAKVDSANTIETLISMGADVNAVDSTNWTALIWALRFNIINKSAIVRVLLENGAKVVVNRTNALGFTNDDSIRNLLRQYQ